MGNRLGHVWYFMLYNEFYRLTSLCNTLDLTKYIFKIKNLSIFHENPTLCYTTLYSSIVRLGTFIPAYFLRKKKLWAKFVQDSDMETFYEAINSFSPCLLHSGPDSKNFVRIQNMEIDSFFSCLMLSGLDSIKMCQDFRIWATLFGQF